VVAPARPLPHHAAFEIFVAQALGQRSKIEMANKKSPKASSPKGARSPASPAQQPAQQPAVVQNGGGILQSRTRLPWVLVVAAVLVAAAAVLLGLVPGLGKSAADVSRPASQQQQHSSAHARPTSDEEKLAELKTELDADDLIGRMGKKKKKDVPSLADEHATLMPAPEREIGLEGSMQRLLMTGPTPFASFVVANEEGTVPIDVFWQGRLITMAAPGFRARVETWIGHEFSINNETVVVDGSFAALVYEPGRSTLARRSVVPPEAPKRLPKPVPLYTTAKAIKIRNLSKHRFHEFWVPDDPGAEISYQGVIEPHSETTTNSYLTHRFRFTDLKDKKKVVYEFRVNENEDVYAYVDRETANPRQLKQHDEEMAFAKDYLERTGRHWYSYYPHRPVRSFMWPADVPGQVHTVHSNNLPDGVSGELTLRVIATEPRAFLVKNFFSKAEAEAIISIAKDSLSRSSVSMHDENGNLVASNTRTSKNAWVSRGTKETTPILDRIFRRAADLLRLDEKYIHHDYPNGTTENMQVVYYGPNGAAYAPHHDWGVKGPYTRLITLLLYLNDMPSKKSGGETAFPKANTGRPEGYSAHAGMGNAVLFYSQHPDGNVDDKSLHEAKAVKGQGEKWLANFWVHDSIFWRTDF